LSIYVTKDWGKTTYPAAYNSIENSLSIYDAERGERLLSHMQTGITLALPKVAGV
jgi:hypothetical protein